MFHQRSTNLFSSGQFLEESVGAFAVAATDRSYRLVHSDAVTWLHLSLFSFTSSTSVIVDDK